MIMGGSVPIEESERNTYDEFHTKIALRTKTGRQQRVITLGIHDTRHTA